MSLPTEKRGGNKSLIFLRLLGHSFKEMKKNDPLRMAGATAFFTTFALPPILIILFQLFSLFLSKKLVGSELMEVLTDTFGSDVAKQVRRTTAGFRTLVHNWYIAIPGFLFLLFVGTTLFGIIKNTLDDIWNIKVKEKPGLLFSLRLRARSAGVILITGLLFLAGILLDGFEILAGNNIGKISPEAGKYFKSAINEIAGILIVTAWFIVLFRYLADGRPSWKAAIAGGFLTGLLFSGGKELLSLLMRSSNVVSIYGASASMVLMLLFVFYSSFILYFGASFIKVYSDKSGSPIKPIDNAYSYRLQQLK
jgi:membrane protein